MRAADTAPTWRRLHAVSGPPGLMCPPVPSTTAPTVRAVGSVQAQGRGAGAARMMRPCDRRRSEPWLPPQALASADAGSTGVGLLQWPGAAQHPCNFMQVCRGWAWPHLVVMRCHRQQGDPSTAGQQSCTGDERAVKQSSPSRALIQRLRGPNRCVAGLRSAVLPPPAPCALPRDMRLGARGRACTLRRAARSIVLGCAGCHCCLSTGALFAGHPRAVDATELLTSRRLPAPATEPRAGPGQPPLRAAEQQDRAPRCWRTAAPLASALRRCLPCSLSQPAWTPAWLKRMGRSRRRRQLRRSPI